MNHALTASIRSFPGVGEKRAEAYHRLGIGDGYALLRHFPRGYQHRGNVKSLAEAENGEICALLLTVGTQPKSALLKNRLTLTKFTVFDDTGKCTVVFFNQNYIRDVFHVGGVFRFWAKVTKLGGKTELTSPQFEPCLPNRPLPEFIPLYPLVSGLSQKILYNACGIALMYAAEEPCDEILPAGFRKEKNLPDFADACRMLHRPLTFQEIETGRSYFIYEELYKFALGLAVSRAKHRQGTPPRLAAAELTPFLSSLPFSLTGAQKKAISDIRRDLFGENGKGAAVPMARMISGDVGSGKTAVAAAAVYLTVKGGFQALLMAPTEILANQHYADLSQLFAGLGISVALLTGSMSAAKKRAVRAALSAGTVDLVVGTHALLSEGVRAARCGLVVTDEQHRFGVGQRTALSSVNSGEADPHVLVMSATPIPRTLSLILYGDLEVSTLDELPPGRQKVDTFVVNESYRSRLNAFISKQVSEGGQVYIVCPSVEAQEVGSEDDELDRGGEIISIGATSPETTEAKPPLRSAVEFCHELQAVFPALSVAFLHGKMKAAEKDRVMCSFAAGEIQILVSTTVIEVGVNVPNACLMIVENAERFGLSQLHQLRGRVGRGSRKSYCILVSDTKSETAKKRLAVMRETCDGYKISEKDLELRGPGDFFPSDMGGARQSGDFRLGIASLCADITQLKEAFAEAAKTVSDDPQLEKSENQPAKAAMEQLFSLNSNAMN